MSKRRERITTNADRTRGAIRSAPEGAAAPPIASGESAGKTRWLIFGGTALVLVVGWGWYFFGEGRDGPAPLKDRVGVKERKKEPRTPTEAEKLVERFIEARRAGDARVLAMLADLPDGDGPISEEEFERRAAGHFLRDKGLTVLEYSLGGTTGGKDGFVLVTRGSSRTPHMRVLEANGKDSATALSMFNPDIIVEVRGDKIHPIRTEAHRDR